MSSSPRAARAERMPTRRVSSLVWAGSALALTLVLGACTAGGQFDPTELLTSDVFGTKKKLQGDREPLFPNGVPGAETGVPPDLMKGYQAPPDQADNVEAKPAPTPAAAPPPKPKPKPKPAVARAPTPQPAPQAKSGQQAWPAPQSSTAAQTNWPAPPQPGAAQTNWPPPPQAGQAPQTAQPGQSVWPAPPPPGTPPGTYSR